MKDKIRLRVLVKDVTIVKNRRWGDQSYTTGRVETIQRWNAENGWIDLPREYENIWIEKGIR